MKNKQISHLMTRDIITVDRQMTIVDAAATLERAHIGSVIVLDAGQPAGILTERDILRALSRGVTADACVEQLMSAPLVSLSETTQAHAAYHTMISRGIRHLLVTGQDGQPVGVVSESDFRNQRNLDQYLGLRMVASVMNQQFLLLDGQVSVREAAAEMEKRALSCVLVEADHLPVGIVTERDMVTLFRRGAADATLSSVMSAPLRTISPHTQLMDAVQMMRSQRLRHLVVLADDGTLAGMLNEHDVVKELEGEYIGMLQDMVLEQAGQASEDKFRALVEHLPYQIFVKDRASVYLTCNRSYAHDLGIPVEAVIGKNDFDFFPRELAERYRADDQRVMDQAITISVEELYQLRDGIERWLHTTKAPVRNAEGEITGVVGIFEDITSRKQSEAHELHHRQVLEMMAKGAPLKLVLEKLVLLMQSECPGTLCSVTLLDDKNRLRMGAAPDLPDFYNQAVDGLEIGPNVGSCGTAAYTRDRVIVEDIQQHPYWESFRELAKQAGVQSCWSQPILAADGKVLGTFAIYHPVPALPTQQELQLVEAYADLAALAIEHARAQENLHKLSQVVKHSPVMIMITDRDSILEYVNPRFTQLTGYSYEEVVGRNPRFLKSGLMAESVYQEMYQTLLSGEEWRGEFCNRNKNTELMWLDTHIMPVRGEGGEITHMISVQEDITERKRNEQAIHDMNLQLGQMVTELQRRERDMTLINRMNEMLQTCHTLEEAYELIALSAGELFEGYNGGLAIYDKQSRMLETVAQWGEHPVLLPVFSADDCWALRAGQAYELADPHKAMTCNHFLSEVEGGYLSVPLVVQGNILGLLHINSHKVGLIPPDRKQVATTFGEVVKLALANIELREQLREQATRDPLTGLFNRRYLDDTLPRELHRSRRANLPFCVAMLDIDHFKRFNDEHGHEAGDEVLRTVGQLLNSGLRRSDIACRFGGEEFVVIMPGSTPEAAQQRLEELRSHVGQARIVREGVVLPRITVSVGLVSQDWNMAMEPAMLVRCADEALYTAKEAGRDCIRVYHHSS